MLLTVLLLLSLASVYMLLFYMPLTEWLATLDGQIAQSQDLILDSQIKVERQSRMQRELKNFLPETTWRLTEDHYLAWK